MLEVHQVPPPPPNMPVPNDDFELMRFTRRASTIFAFYALALFAVLAFVTGSIILAIFILAVTELILSLQRPIPVLGGPASYADPNPASWQSTLRAIRVVRSVQTLQGLAWGFVVTTIVFPVFLVLAGPWQLGWPNLAVAALFAAYFLTRPFWHSTAMRTLGRSLGWLRKDLASLSPSVSLAPDGLVVARAFAGGGPGRKRGWTVGFAEIDELRSMGALDAQNYWETMMQYDPLLKLRAAKELMEFFQGRLPRPSIYMYTSFGTHLLVRGPTVLYLFAYADEVAPRAIAAWQAFRAAKAN